MDVNMRVLAPLQGTLRAGIWQSYSAETVAVIIELAVVEPAMVTEKLP